MLILQCKYFLLIFLANIQYGINILSLNGFSGPAWVPSCIYNGILGENALYLQTNRFQVDFWKSRF